MPVTIEEPRSQPIYEVDRLIVDLYTDKRTIRAVDDCSFSIKPGETLAIVGESGSGKTVMTLGPLGLLPEGSRFIFAVRRSRPGANFLL